MTPIPMRFRVAAAKRRRTRKSSLALNTIAYSALGVILVGGLAAGFAYPATEPAPRRTITVRDATPLESLTRQLQRAYEMDRIQAGGAR